jgi:hypothetical protein
LVSIKINNNDNNISVQLAHQLKIEIDKLDQVQNGTKAKLNSIGFNEEILLDYQNRSLFDVARILPFNYS